MNEDQRSLNVFPWPKVVELREGSLDARRGFTVSGDQELQREFASFERALNDCADASGGSPHAVRLYKVADEELGDEGYRLTIGADGLVVRTQTEAGAFYASQTLRMTLLGGGESPRLPFLEIMDRPEFAWRGFMLDVSRHFFDAEQIKRLIDWLALHKLNVFHWHLTDDGGWRMQVRSHPELTETGGWRLKKDVLWDYSDIEFATSGAALPVYGGLYTQDEIREVVTYASERHVAVLPEIEMPGHSLAACWSNPGVTCTEEAQRLFTEKTRMHRPNVFCAGKEQSFHLIEDVLLEVMEMFPSEVIHIGGDEVDKTLWSACSDCQARMRAEGCADEDELQSYFIRRIEEFLNRHGRRLMGWDEILEGGLPPNAAVMSWRGIAGGVAAAREGHQVVMTPTSHCYFDYSYEIIPFEKAILFDPLRGLTENERKYVLGGQANLWTEYVPSMAAVEQRMFPRLAATAEALWTGTAHVAEASERLPGYLGKLDALGIRYEGAVGRTTEGSFQEGVLYLNA